MRANGPDASRVAVAGWAVVALGWLALTVRSPSIVPTRLGFGVALVVAGIGGVAAAGSPLRARLTAGGFFVVGGAAFAQSVADPARLPVGESTLSLVGNLAMLVALVLVFAGRRDGDADGATG